MTDENKTEAIQTLAPKTEVESNDQKLDLIYKLLRQRHELQQVCLEVLRGLEHSERKPIMEVHWRSELGRVLFEQDVFLYCNRDLLEGLGKQ